MQRAGSLKALKCKQLAHTHTHTYASARILLAAYMLHTARRSAATNSYVKHAWGYAQRSLQPEQLPKSVAYMRMHIGVFQL